ncbi:hypothetical protein BST61_g10421 [Cercospora zeina]
MDSYYPHGVRFADSVVASSEPSEDQDYSESASVAACVDPTFVPSPQFKQFHPAIDPLAPQQTDGISWVDSDENPWAGAVVDRGDKQPPIHTHKANPSGEQLFISGPIDTTKRAPAVPPKSFLRRVPSPVHGMQQNPLRAGITSDRGDSISSCVSDITQIYFDASDVLDDVIREAAQHLRPHPSPLLQYIISDAPPEMMKLQQQGQDLFGSSFDAATDAEIAALQQISRQLYSSLFRPLGQALRDITFDRYTSLLEAAEHGQQRASAILKQRLENLRSETQMNPSPAQPSIPSPPSLSTSSARDPPARVLRMSDFRHSDAASDRQPAKNSTNANLQRGNSASRRRSSVMGFLRHGKQASDELILERSKGSSTRLDFRQRKHRNEESYQHRGFEAIEVEPAKADYLDVDERLSAAKANVDTIATEVRRRTASQAAAERGQMWNAAASEQTQKLERHEKEVTTEAKEFVKQVANSLFLTKESIFLSSSALKEGKIGRQRLERHFRRSVVAFGKSLISEAVNRDQLCAAHLLGSRFSSARIARNVVERCELHNSNDHHSTHGVTRTEPQTLSDANDTLGDQSEASDGDQVVDEQQNDESTPDFAAVESFLSDSEAYKTFNLSHLAFVQGPYEARISRAIGQKIISDSGQHLYDVELKSIIQELSWVPTHLFSLSTVEKLSLSDALKGKIESIMGEKWDWWPLAKRKRVLQQGFVRVKWSTPCREFQHIDIGEESAQSFTKAIATSPAFVDDHVPIGRTSGSPLVVPKSQLSSSNSGTMLPLVSQSLACTTLHWGRPLDSSRCESASAKGPHDDHFYDWIAQTYLKLRGPLARCLSPWRYDHCEFYQFYKRYEVEPSKQDFPPDDDRLYDFMPRPLERYRRPPHGPIMAKDFRHNYYRCPEYCHSWHGHRYRRVRCLSRDDIQTLPKRTYGIDLDDGRQELFWGLYAKEERSFAWILAYGVLINVPGMLFFLLVAVRLEPRV